MNFTPADHVTEREPGPWRDCTFASMLETMRLGLPLGRKIPATEAEKERFRAAAGFADNHAGARIDQTLAAAQRLYGLSDDDYTLTADWARLAPLLEDPEAVVAVTGLMGALPATVHRWDTFTGPHCVAKHDVRVLCDPLAPKDAKYRGEEVSLAGWRAYFVALPYAQAFVMKAAGEPMIQLPEGLTSPQVVRIVKAGDLLDAPGGKRIAAAVVGRLLPYLGTVPGYKAVSVRTSKPYADGKERPTQLFVRADMAVIETVPPVAPTPGSHTVSLEIDGAAAFSRTF